MSPNRNSLLHAHRLRAVADLVEHDALTVALVEVCGWKGAARLAPHFERLAPRLTEQLRDKADQMERR
jgi:hypothetical protein